MKELNILLLEDSEFDIFLINKTLKNAGLEFDITVVANEKKFLEALQNNTYTAILSDNSLPQFDATSALAITKSKNLTIPFILVTGTVSEEFAVQIMKDGAWDYILKDRLQRLPNALVNAINKHKLEAEYKKKVQDIIESEALMKEAERLARFGSWEVDVVTGIHYWSDEHYRMLGYTVREVPPSFNNFVARIHHEDQYNVQCVIDDAFKQLTHQKYLCRINNKKGGTTRHIEGEIFITKDDQGKLVRMNGFTRDVSEKRDAEIQVIESERKYQNLFINNPVPTWVMDCGTLRFLDVNKAAIKNYGYSYNQFLSMTYADIVVPDDNTNGQRGEERQEKHKMRDGTIIQVGINTVETVFEGKTCKLMVANNKSL